jgi:ubiquinone/menaquinone biosynthesis C-methylase UbiE
MTQNIYDDSAFFEGYSRLNRSIRGLDGAPEWPALRAQLPDMHKLNVLDLGCGYGWFCRWAAENGAASVGGIDVSEKMLERASSMTTNSKINYRRADLETLELQKAAFNLVHSSLTFHYIVNLRALLRSIYCSLVPGGRLVFSIEHPIFMAPRHPGFRLDSDGHKTWPVDSYQLEGRRVTNWLAEGVVKQHRTIGTLVNLLIESGFTLKYLNEWGPTQAQIDAMPELAEERERPMMLLVSAHR